MTLSVAALVFAGLAIVILLYSGAWTDRTYSRFSEIPAHYDFRGNATRLAPRRQMAWLLPGLFSAMLVFSVALFEWLPAEMQNGDPSFGLGLTTFTLLAAQGLLMWLLARWARAQGAN